MNTGDMCMSQNDKKIGLALSGGGYRATVFHLGVLKYLAEKGLLKNIEFVSTVSGGSLVPGLIFNQSKMQWPDDQYFINSVLPEIKTLITKKPLQVSMIAMKIAMPWYIFFNGAKTLSYSLKFLLGINKNLQDLPDKPRWIINSTAYQTGKNWRFEKRRMGDWVANYVFQPDVSISDAVAASCGYPVLVGPLILKSQRYNWHKVDRTTEQKTESTDPSHNKYHLWDGALYENLGLEGIFKPDADRPRKEIDTVIVADAGYSRLLYTSRTPFSWTKRLLDIPLRQIHSLRTRKFWSQIKKDPSVGAYVKIGRTFEETLCDYEIQKDDVPKDWSFYDDTKIEGIASYPSDFCLVSEDIFDALVQHGYEAARLSTIKLF